VVGGGEVAEGGGDGKLAKISILIRRIGRLLGHH